jgi:hypothetical protein
MKVGSCALPMILACSRAARPVAVLIPSGPRSGVLSASRSPSSFRIAWPLRQANSIIANPTLNARSRAPRFHAAALTAISRSGVTILCASTNSHIRLARPSAPARSEPVCADPKVIARRARALPVLTGIAVQEGPAIRHSPYPVDATTQTRAPMIDAIQRAAACMWPTAGDATMRLRCARSGACAATAHARLRSRGVLPVPTRFRGAQRTRLPRVAMALSSRAS